MLNLRKTLAFSLLFPLILAVAHAGQTPTPWTLVESVDVAPVWSGHSVGFALLTKGEQQYVAYYDDERRMTVVSRRLNSTHWRTKMLPTMVGWDSHNYVTMALDSDGQLHVSGNMHCAPLIYFRTTEPGDVTSLMPI